MRRYLWFKIRCSDWWNTYGRRRVSPWIFYVFCVSCFLAGQLFAYIFWRITQ